MPTYFLCRYSLECSARRLHNVARVSQALAVRHGRADPSSFAWQVTHTTPEMPTVVMSGDSHRELKPNMDKAGTAVAYRPLVPQAASTEEQGTRTDPTARYAGPRNQGEGPSGFRRRGGLPHGE